MNNKKNDIAILGLLFIPVFMALGGIIIKFNIIDLIYLLLVVAIFFNCFFKVRKTNN